MTGRICNRCEEHKDWSSFALNSKGLNGRKSICKVCSNTAQIALAKKRRKENPEKWREARWEKQIKSEYGLSARDYQRLREEQKNVCAICLKEPNKKLFVDHCHTTGKVRGLLCQHCNTLLGMARDDTLTLKNAVHYLERSKRMKLYVSFEMEVDPDTYFMYADDPTGKESARDVLEEMANEIGFEMTELEIDDE